MVAELIPESPILPNYPVVTTDDRKIAGDLFEERLVHLPTLSEIGGALIDLTAHLVEGSGKLRDFVGAGTRRLGAVLAASHSRRALLEPFEMRVHKKDHREPNDARNENEQHEHLLLYPGPNHRM